MSDAGTQLSRLIWSVADLLRGDFKTSDYGRVVLPFTVLRRLDCMLAPTRQKVLSASEELADSHALDPDSRYRDAVLRRASGHHFYNTSPITLENVAADPSNTAKLLRWYVDSFSPNVKEVIEHFEFDRTVRRLDEAGLLYKIVAQFLSLDLGPALSSHEMGLVFEDLVRRFAEQTSEIGTSEHVTPRDVGSLMAALLVKPDLRRLTEPGLVRTVYDPVCGTGGLLGEAADRIKAVNSETHVFLYGQESNAETWAVAGSNMLMSGHDPERMRFGNVLREDGFPGERFDYLLAHPPFGVSWKKVEEDVRNERELLGDEGRFAAGLPRISDGSLLFLQHMLAKMKPGEASGHGGSRIVALFSGSPMHAGAAGSGQSDIRRWIVENDWLEGIVALPDQLLYNTGIATYLWILSNHKSADRRGRVTLIKAQDRWQKMRLSLGSKRKYLGPDQINGIVQLYGEALSATQSRSLRDHVRVVRNEELLYRQIVIERPLRLRFELTPDGLDQLAALRPIQRVESPEALLTALRGVVGTSWATQSEAFSALRRAAGAAGQIWPRGAAFEKAVRNVLGVREDGGELQQRQGAPEPDPELRDLVVVPFQDDPEEYFRNKVLPHTPDAWLDRDRTRLGCAIPSSLFYVAELDGPFEPLQNFARLETERVKLRRPEPGEGKPVPPKHLTASHLQAVDSAVELPDAELDNSELTPCAGGDLVGRSGNWRLLPVGFGEAVTPLFVLHPLRGGGRGLCEWLNSRKGNSTYPQARELLDTPVPVELVTAHEVDELLEDIQEGRRALRVTTEGILPNVFAGSEALTEEIRKSIRFASREARLVGQLVRPFDDPVWRAESSYPFHVAALARRYRVSTHPAERKDGLLKLGEGTARTLGILALSELIAHHQSFTRPLRQQFRTGATFGTWLTLIKRFLADVEAPRLPELEALRERDTTQSLLKEIKDFRNNSHHAHGVRMSHELDEDVEKLEPRVVSAISSVNWLSSTDWFWVERCEYLDESSFRAVGLRLRGSHPSWEPFERSITFPLRPDRIYVDGTPSGKPVDLWPLAMVSLCSDCRTWELFLLNQIRDDKAVLRSLEEHELEIPYPISEED
ncbi:type I restriction-modification system subunit M [Streptomyces sp. NBC_01728]|uniref:type I restriction-modification system subunit M n=1 Tax=unclassified Streptomyces TaxID=2593676 RepID=UPI00224E99EF|nr:MULTISPECIES: class I SAM-dependent DNA methyltransferase [unclassified Streptomyces]MCX4455750.1 type I restriction-modification system subunit M [Streptomyces sp. NBC_01719]MCX4495110.1 type I restriction-modification system subunit M [Streptomyces sp. NBC_01728]